MARRTRATDDLETPWFYGVGTTSGSFDVEREATAGTIWIPDPEQRHGWRESYVGRPVPKPGARPVGFGKPGAR